MNTAFNSPVSTEAPEVVALADDFAVSLAHLDAGPELILDAVEAHPSTPILQLYAALFYAFGQTTETIESGQYHLAKVPETGLTSYEQALRELLEKWLANEFHAALTLSEKLNLAYPDDLLCLKGTEFLYYCLGQHHNGERFRKHFASFAERHAGQPDFLAMYAFAHELCGRFDDATEIAERAIELEERNPWAEHALSHVLIRQGRPQEGIDRMTKFLPLLRTCNRLIYAHDAWHLALLHLEQLDFNSADRVYRTDIWGITPDMVGEQLDAISYLWRVEMAGEDRSESWGKIADQIEPRAEEVFIPFLNSHFTYALARAGREEALDAMLNAVRGRAEYDDQEAREVWQRSGVAVVEAAAASGLGNYRHAAEVLEPAIPDLTRIGGSDAQDDLFRMAYFVALARAGRKADATAYFRHMNEGKPQTTFDRKLEEMAN